MNIVKIGLRGFMGFWYPYVRQLNVMWPSITIEGKRLAISPEVYKPLENEHACVQYVRKGDRVLDLGCGSGVNAVFVAPIAKEVVAVDISMAAVKNTILNCRLQGLKNVKVKKSDMFSKVEGKFDLILANPPYVAVEFDKDDKQFATSTRYLPTLFRDAPRHLAKDGMLVVQFPIWVRGAVEKMAAEQGFRLVSLRRTPLKSLGLFLLSLAYMQMGFRSAFYVFRHKGTAAAKPAKAKARKAARPAARQRTLVPA
ncbi:MAG TPA: methyltransferase [Phenylobacterium sp.]|jgi:predicted RNA methylase|nr:methyltransferase [Phenylobacterium sp.]